MTFGLSVSSRNFRTLRSVSWEVWVLQGYDCIHWVAKSCTATCVSVIVSRFTSFTENFVICCWQVTNIFCSKYWISSAFSARRPCNLGPLAYFAISVFRDIRTYTVFPGCHIRWTFRIWVMRSVCECRHFCLFEITCETTLGDRAIDFSLLDCCHSLCFCFFIMGGSPRSPDARAWVSSRRCRAGPGEVLDESCRNDVEDEPELELEDNPGTTTGLRFSVLHGFFPFLVRWGFWPLAHSEACQCSSQSLPNDKTASASSSSCTVTNRLGLWTNTCASSWVCTYPLAVNTTAGFLDLFTVPISSELKSFLLSMCIDAPGSTTNSRSSGFFEEGPSITHASVRE